MEMKVAELEHEILVDGDLKARLKQENTQLVHRYRKLPTKASARRTSVLMGAGARLRVNELEEQLKDQETRAEQSLRDELRRHREAYGKMDRDKNTQIELLNLR